MSLLDDRTLIILDNGFVRTSDKNGELIEPKFYTKTVYPIPRESGDTVKSTDEPTTNSKGKLAGLAKSCG